MSEEEKKEVQRADLYVRLLTTHYQKIYTYIFSLIPNCSDADDLMQEVTSKMLANFNDFEEGTNFVAWGRKIAFYEILMFRRKRGREHVFFRDPETLSAISDYYRNKGEQVDMRVEALQECIEKLPSKEKHLIAKRYKTGSSMKTMSHEMGVHISTLYRMFERIHRLLIGCIRKVIAID